MTHRHPVTLEWVLSDQEALRAALPAMLRFRKLNLESLAWAMARDGVARNVVAAFMNGRQKNWRSDTFFDTMDALGLEVVVRRKSERNVKTRTAALRAERGLPPVDEDKQQAVIKALVPDDRRDETGRIKGPLTEQEKAEAHALLDTYLFS